MPSVRAHRVIENHKAAREIAVGYGGAASVGGEGGLVSLRSLSRFAALRDSGWQKQVEF